MATDHKTNKGSLASLAASMVIFGTVGIFRRYIPLSSGMLAFVRGMLGTLFLIAFVKIRGGKIRHGIGLKNVIWLVVSGIAIGFNWILLFEAYNYTTISVATLCYYMQPVFVILASPFVLREKPSVRKLVCAAVAIFGMVLVSGVFSGEAQDASDLRGIFYGLGAAALYASVILMNKKVQGIDAFEKTIVQLLSAALVMVPYLLLTEDFSAIRLETRTIWMVLVVGIVHTGIAYVMYFGSMEGLKAQTIAIFSYIDPVTALILSAILLNETLSAAGIVGAVLILGAAIVSELKVPARH